jgi:hypothetical protein
MAFFWLEHPLPFPDSARFVRPLLSLFGYAHPFKDEVLGCERKRKSAGQLIRVNR